MAQALTTACQLGLLLGAPASVLVWYLEPPGMIVWMLRIVFPGVTALSLGVLVGRLLSPELSHDYLRAVVGKYFTRDGLAFALHVSDDEGIAYLNVLFQNQYDEPCIALIAVRPGRGFWMNRPAMPTLLLDIECPPAGFGAVRAPLPIPTSLQGKRVVFEVGASVDYPDGKGQRLIFHDGTQLHADHNFGDRSRKLLFWPALILTLSVLGPESVKLRLPRYVADELAHDDVPGELAIFWQSGDPPLECLPQVS